MTGEQLALFLTPRPGPGRGRCYSGTGMAENGWRGAGQFYYDARRWLAGEPLNLTAAQITYIETGEPAGVGRPA